MKVCFSCSNSFDKTYKLINSHICIGDVFKRHRLESNSRFEATRCLVVNTEFLKFVLLTTLHSEFSIHLNIWSHQNARKYCKFQVKFDLHFKDKLHNSYPYADGII